MAEEAAEVFGVKDEWASFESCNGAPLRRRFELEDGMALIVVGFSFSVSSSSVNIMDAALATDDGGEASDVLASLVVADGVGGVISLPPCVAMNAAWVACWAWANSVGVKGTVVASDSYFFFIDEFQ